MKQMWRSALALMTALLLACGSASAGIQGLDEVLSPWTDADDQLHYAMTAEIATLVPYGEETIAMMNGVLKHLSMNASVSSDATVLKLCADGDALMDFTQTEGEDGTELTTSLLPNRTLRSAQSAMDVLTGSPVQQEAAFDFFAAISELEGCYQALTDAIIPYAEEKKANYKIKNIGSSRWSRVARLTEEQSAEIAPLIADVLSCGMDEAYRAQLSGLSCSKGFVVALYQTKEGGDDLAVYMKGTITLADGKPRALAYQWAFSEDDGVRTDSLKYEVVKSKTKVDFTREVHALIKRSADKKLLVDGECELEVKQNGVTSVTTHTYDLSGKKDGDARTITGSFTQAVRTTQGDKSETITLTITPEMKITSADGESVLSGSAALQQKKGKTVLADVTLLFDEEPARLLKEAELSGALYEVQAEEALMPPSSLTQNVEITILGAEEEEEEKTEDYLVGEPPIGLQSYASPADETTVDLDGADQDELDDLMGEIAQRLAGRLLIALTKLPQEDAALIRDNLSEEDYATFLTLVEGL